MRTTFAAVAVSPGQVEFQQVASPQPGPDDVIVRITHSWISNGTEGSFVRGERIAGDTPRTPGDPSPFPHISGYQKVGVLEWVGENVENLRVGDTVFATVSRVDGLFFDHGGHISPAVTHKSQIWKLPEGLDPIAASGLVLTQVGYNVGIRPTITPGERVVMIGDGMVGHWAAQTFQHRGAKVLLLGRHEDRLGKFALSEGDAVANTTERMALECVRDWAGSESVAAVAHTAGDIATVESLYPCLKHFGHVVSAGFVGTQGQLDVQKLRAKELTLHAPAGWTKDRMDATLALLAEGAITTKHLITHRFPASQAGEAFDLILSRSEPVLGVVLDWEGVGES